MPSPGSPTAFARREWIDGRPITTLHLPDPEDTPVSHADEPQPPIPADDAPHAWVAVQRYHSVHADRPEWAAQAVVVPEWDHDSLAAFRRQGRHLLPIGPNGDTGTRAITTETSDLAEEVKELRATLAAIKAVDPDLFDPTGGTDRGAAYETYGSAGEELREKFLAAIGVNVNDYDEETCPACDEPVGSARIVDEDTGESWHAECWAKEDDRDDQ
ncbi:hypothetical protein [Nocardia sp. MW-W600-9]